MKNISKIPAFFYLMACLFFSFLAEAQEQVVIKGNATTNTFESVMERNVRNGIKGFLITIANSGLDEVLGGGVQAAVTLTDMGASSTTSQDFTITYTQEMMHMVASETVNGVTRAGTMILRFNPEGTQLNMTILVPNQNPMTMMVPRSNTIATSYTQNLMTPAPVSNVEINGFETGKYNFHTEGNLVLNDVIINVNPMELKRVNEGSVWLAPDAPGIGLMRGFYLNLRLGGYDLAGAEKAGIMALMDRLLERGMPIKVKETMIISSYESEDFMFKTVTETNIRSVVVEPLNEELATGSNNTGDLGATSNTDSDSPLNTQEGSQSESQVDNNSTSDSQNESSNASNEGATNECDCSCEAYAKFIKQAEQNKKSKKSKKKTDQERMQEMDFNCMQKCMTKWTRCMTIKN